MISLKFQLIPVLLMALAPGIAGAQSGPGAGDIRARWEHANFELTEDARIDALEELSEQCNQAAMADGQNAELLTWCGITWSSYAGVRGGLGALGTAKRARTLLERAVAIDRGVVNGAALCSLGTLYAKVPGWPLGFGDDEKAEAFLSEALRLAPDDLDNNYFMADFLVSDKREAEALPYLERAAQTAPRPDREIADRGRQVDIRDLMAKIDH